MATFPHYPVPDTFPANCIITGLDGAEHGPYWRVGDRPMMVNGNIVDGAVWVSEEGIKTIARDEASSMGDQELQVRKLQIENEELREEIADLKDWIKDHEDEVRKLKTKGLDITALAEAVGKELHEGFEGSDLRLQRKPVPKKKKA